MCGGAAFAIILGCELASAPFPPITLNGRELSPVPDVWTLQEPAAPVEPDDEEKPASAGRSPVITGALAGALFGCAAGAGAALADASDDIDGVGFCVLTGLFYAGVGAGVGALVQWIRGLTDP